jgi:hypothetical protein
MKIYMYIIVKLHFQITIASSIDLEMGWFNFLRSSPEQRKLTFSGAGSEGVVIHITAAHGIGR